MQPTLAFLIAAFFVSFVGAIYDLRAWRIPNWLTFGAVLVAPIAHGIVEGVQHGAQSGLISAGGSVVGALLCALVPWLCWRFGTFGGGDVKLLAAVGALCLPKLGITIEFDAIIVALIFGCGRLAYDGQLFRTFGRALLLAVNPFLPKARRRELPPSMMTPMRFGPAIAGGVLVCAVSSFFQAS